MRRDLCVDRTKMSSAAAWTVQRCCRWTGSLFHSFAPAAE